VGNVKDWLSFWSQFNRIHEDKEMQDEDKFQYFRLLKAAPELEKLWIVTHRLERITQKPLTV
jgi:hypothetical protein